jgi:L-lactate utilization protein LutC
VPTDDLTATFMTALTTCGGSSAVVSREGLADAVAALVGGQGLVLVGPELGSLCRELLARGVDARPGSSGEPRVAATPSLAPTTAAADFADAAARAACGVTGARLGIAASGTVAIDGRSGNAGLLSCLPPHHVAVLQERLIERDLADALGVLAGEASTGGAGFVLISGPSRTSDIEMMSVLGVHGPLRLDVLIVREGR